MNYSNPVKHLEVTDWPYGKFRTHATFMVESAKKGERVSRITVNPKTGRDNKPKKTTFSKLARIVTGEDNRTYIAELSIYNHITIRESNLQYEHEVIHDNDPRFADLIKLFE